MMKNRRKFLEICESVLTRTERGGFLVGDVIKIKDLNKVDPNIREELKAFIDQGLNIKVIDIVNKYPSDKPGSQQNNTGDVTLIVGADYGGGRYVGRFPIPRDAAKTIVSYPNLDPIPDALKRDNQITLKPEPVPGFNNEFTSQTNKSDDGSGKLTPGDRSLNNTNVDIPGQAASTINYMTGVK